MQLGIPSAAPRVEAVYELAAQAATDTLKEVVLEPGAATILREVLGRSLQHFNQASALARLPVLIAPFVTRPEARVLDRDALRLAQPEEATAGESWNSLSQDRNWWSLYTISLCRQRPRGRAEPPGQTPRA
jgi:hypothetical protein